LAGALPGSLPRGRDGTPGRAEAALPLAHGGAHPGSSVAEEAAQLPAGAPAPWSMMGRPPGSKLGKIHFLCIDKLNINDRDLVITGSTRVLTHAYLSFYEFLGFDTAVIYGLMLKKVHCAAVAGCGSFAEGILPPKPVEEVDR